MRYYLPNATDDVLAMLGEVPLMFGSGQEGDEVIAIFKHKENRRVISDNFIANAKLVSKLLNEQIGAD